SHELKTPVATIEGLAALIQDERASSEEKKEYAEQLKESTQKLSEHINNILMLSKLESQEIISENKRFRIDEQIRRIILFLEPLWSKKELLLTINMDIAYYYGNEGLLFHLWQNLLENAMKFTGKGGTVSVDVSEINGSVTVKVSDDGIGIRKEDTERIFSKFYRTSSASEYAGNGLGLALVKKITELYGGQVKVESEQGRGSVFTVILPNNSNGE
ncbi:MAG TPA: two-component sensor histidine kinase, partial [Clostridiales bacterium]|nr:two-component sensor histidine kinase [Clostridiales bacterium]